MKLTKLQPAPNPVCPTPKMEDYILGDDNPGVSLPVDYWIEGHLIGEIKEGAPINVERHSRNGVTKLGLFSSSPVRKIVRKDGVIYATTDNSIYKIEE